MENNNFERQVRRKLSELSIKPSEKTWTGIENHIRKKDNSKRILWFLLIGLFLLAGGGYLFLKDGEVVDKMIAQKSTTNRKAIVQESPIDAGGSKNTTIEESQIVLNEGEKSIVPSEERTMDNPSGSLISPEDSHRNFKERETGTQEPVTKEIVIMPAEASGTGIEEEVSARSANSVTLPKNNTITSAPVADSTLKSTNVLVGNEGGSLLLNESSIKELPNQKRVIRPEIKEAEIAREGNGQMKVLDAAEKKSNTPSHKSWEIGMSFSASKVSLGAGIQLGVGLEKSGLANDPVNFENNYFLNPGSSMSQTRIGPPSSPKNSYGFNAGIVLKKEMSPKVSFATGLGYSYFTNSLLVGKQTSSGNFSSAGVLSPHRNNFHFVELPLSAQFHLNRNHKLPLDLSIGLNISQLLSSNAFQYKEGFYAVDNSVFTKTQIGFNVGFSATFFRNIAIGPFYQYGFNSLAKEGLYGKQHLNFLGVKADFYFGKNK